MRNVYFKGFNALRFFAAFLVLISHAYITFNKANPGSILPLPLLHKGAEAVEFFFTLSGFLITYLLLVELKGSGGIDIRQFYMRRVLRIWPLYFIIVSIGFVLFGVVYPKVYGGDYFNFSSIASGLFLYVFFLPNVASSLFKVGLLFPLWSIGVEEQFYIFWAPLLKFFKNKILSVILTIAVISCFVSLVGDYGYFLGEAGANLVNTFKFHCMSIGGLAAYLLFNKKNNDMLILRNSAFQWSVVVLASLSILSDATVDLGTLGELLRSVVYALLLIVISHKNAVINLELAALGYLGRISYGIYMYHLLIDYFLRMNISRMAIGNAVIDFLLYAAALLAVTVTVSAFSYRFIERPIMQKRFPFFSALPHGN